MKRRLKETSKALVLSVAQLLDARYGFETLTSRKALYRGQADASWPVVSPIARVGDFELREWDELFQDWCLKAREIGGLPRSEWERLALAQHHGLRTPLLDWSTNPLVALYFAVCDLPNSDGAVYFLAPAVFAGPSTAPDSLRSLLDVMSLGRARKPVYCLQTRAFSQRIRAQHGAFSLHAPVGADLRTLSWPYAHERSDGEALEERLTQVRIPQEAKASIVVELAQLGFSHSRLFPGLDGISREINDRLA